MISDDLKMKGRLIIQLNDEVVQEVDNLVVTTGKGYVASRMKDTTATAKSHMAVGTNKTAAAAGDTALAAEAGRAALTSTTVNTGAGTVTYVGTFAAGTGTGALVEAGILNASSGGTLLCRTVYTTVNKGANDSMTITWVITIS